VPILGVYVISDAVTALPNALSALPPTPPAPEFGYFYGFYFYFAPHEEATPA